MSIEILPNVELRSSHFLEPKVNNRWYDRIRSEKRHEKQKRKHTEALLSKIVVTNPSPNQEQHQPAIVAEVVNQETALKALEKDFLHCYNSQMLALIAATHFQALQSDNMLKAFFFEKLEEWVKKPTMSYGFFAILATPKTDHSALETEEQKISYGVSCIQSLVSSDVLTTTAYPTLKKINNEVAIHLNIDAYTFSAKQCKVHQAVQKTSILGVLFSGNLVFSKESAFIRKKVEATSNNPRFTPEELLYIAANSKLREALKAELQRKTWSLFGNGKSFVSTQDIAGSELKQHVTNLLSDEAATRQTAINEIKQHQYPAAPTETTLAVAENITALVYNNENIDTSAVTIHNLLGLSAGAPDQPYNNVSPVTAPRSSTAAYSKITEEDADDEEIAEINSQHSSFSQTSKTMVTTPVSIRGQYVNQESSPTNNNEKYFSSPETVIAEHRSVSPIDKIDERSFVSSHASEAIAITPISVKEKENATPESSTYYSSPETVIGRHQDNQSNKDNSYFDRTSFTSQRSDNKEMITPQLIKSNRLSSEGCNSNYGSPESIVGKLRDSDEAITPLSVNGKFSRTQGYAKNLFPDFGDADVINDENTSPVSIIGAGI